MDHQEKLEFLANSIKGARKVMEKVEDGKVSTNQNTRRGMSEADVDKMLDSDTNYLAEAPINRTTQQPNPGNYMKNLSKSKMPKTSANWAIVVDSPPGKTKASMLSISLARRTGTASTSQVSKESMCSRTSPCKARTPTFIEREVTNHVLKDGAEPAGQQR